MPKIKAKQPAVPKSSGETRPFLEGTRWLQCDNSIASIKDGKVIVENEEFGRIEYKSTTEITLHADGETLTAKLAAGGGLLQWSDGDTWKLEGFKVPDASPAAVASAENPVAQLQVMLNSMVEPNPAPAPSVQLAPFGQFGAAPPPPPALGVLGAPASTADAQAASAALAALCEENKRWRFKSPDDAPMFIRDAPSLSAGRTGETIPSGNIFEVAEERPATDGGETVFLRLADGRGWAFDKVPGAILCVRHEPQASFSSGSWDPFVAADLNGPASKKARTDGEQQVALSGQTAVEVGAMALLEAAKRQKMEMFQQMAMQNAMGMGMMGLGAPAMGSAGFGTGSAGTNAALPSVPGVPVLPGVPAAVPTMGMTPGMDQDQMQALMVAAMRQRMAHTQNAAGAPAPEPQKAKPKATSATTKANAEASGMDRDVVYEVMPQLRANPDGTDHEATNSAMEFLKKVREADPEKFEEWKTHKASSARHEQDAETEFLLNRWVDLKRAGQFREADEIRAQLRSRGVEPDMARPCNKDKEDPKKWRGFR